jgi:outer membrane biosynthesis protein TonB
MPKLEKGEYECPQCKKLTVIGRTKKVDEPLTCCGVEMVAKEKTKFTEPPEPEEAPTKKKKKAAVKKKSTKKAKKKKKKKKKKTRRRRKKIVIEATLPLTPGQYMCQACGKKQELLATDPRDQWLRCADCFVKMVPIR